MLHLPKYFVFYRSLILKYFYKKYFYYQVHFFKNSELYTLVVVSANNNKTYYCIFLKNVFTWPSLLTCSAHRYINLWCNYFPYMICSYYSIVSSVLLYCWLSAHFLYCIVNSQFLQPCSFHIFHSTFPLT